MVKCPACGEENPPKFRLCGYCGAALAPAAPVLPAREVRKTVTILFSDLKGSTAIGERLDAEALHEVKERYFQSMAAEITRHGGRIEKYIGDAIMAVFGLPRAHEDDALRAVRAALGMRDALVRVNAWLAVQYGVVLSNRTGVNTGEVVASDDPTADQKLATGDAVNVAARLEQAAPENQILLGETTYHLVRDAVTVEQLESLELKGKSRRVPAFRLVSADGLDGRVRRHDRRLVGRDAELSTLRAVYAEVRATRAVRLVTVVGDAGVGKSRLVHEVLERVVDGARVYSGRCLPYGDGITFWPLAMILREAVGIRDADTPEQALARVRKACGDDDVAERLASAAGLVPTSFTLAEINWSARKLLERLAADRPVVVFVDDIHWAENAFLELIEHVVGTARDAPVLMLATARHELLERRTDWGTAHGMTNVVLQPLGDAAAAQVVADLLGGAPLPDDVTARIVDAAEGNPLYAEQMLSHLVDSGALRLEDGRWVRDETAAEIAVPPTITALLEARLDRLARHERAAIEPASVIGLEFEQPAVESLAPPAVRASLAEHLAALMRKQFIRPGSASATIVAAEVVYRFHHHLVRDTVYNGLLKRSRAHLHLEFVRWVDRVAGERAREYEEILGYHLEQALRYLRELGPLDDEGLAVGRDAARRLSSAGRRAAARGDDHAAANLLRRAAGALQAQDPQRATILLDLGDTLHQIGDFGGARAALAEAGEIAERVDDVRVLATAQFTSKLVQLHSGDEAADWGADALAVAERFIPLLEAAGADVELALAWRLVGFVHGVAGRYSAVSNALARSIEHADRAGHKWLVVRNASMQASSDLQGPTPVPEAIRRCEQLLAAGLGDRQVESMVGCTLAQLKAMNGEFEPARVLYRHSRGVLRDLGAGVLAASTGILLADTELRAGDLDGAYREVRADYEFLSAKGETYLLSAIAALLARIVRDLGDHEQALALTRSAEEATTDADIESGALWRIVRASLIARAGDLAAAERLAGEALALARRTESPVLQADALSELARVRYGLGGGADWVGPVDEAISLYRAKGDVVLASAWTRWRAQPVPW